MAKLKTLLFIFKEMSEATPLPVKRKGFVNESNLEYKKTEVLRGRMGFLNKNIPSLNKQKDLLGVL